MPDAVTDYVSADEACALLEIKRASLYSYASRGLVRSVPSEGSRARLYLRADVLRLRARHDARSGHGAVAASALRWGEPVLDSSITEIGVDGPRYRGESAVSLVARHTSFEEVAELLWSGSLPDEAPLYAASARLSNVKRMLDALPRGARLCDRLLSLVTALAALDEDRFSTSDELEVERARTLLATAACLPALLTGNALPKKAPIAELLARGLGAKKGEASRRAIDAALVLSADHELSASAFAARVAASTGADLYACCAAALATFFGPLHGGECDRVEALVREVEQRDDALAFVRERRARGEAPSGFTHRLYPEGDPRTQPLLNLAKKLAVKERTKAGFALIRAMEKSGGEKPTLDVGLVQLSEALALPPGSATLLFAVGRIAGWVAHVLEQRRNHTLLRPRARFVPEPPALRVASRRVR